MPMADRGVETRKTILDATRALFFEKGYHETTYKDICTMAGVNQGLITYHFKSKSALALHFWREFTDTLQARLRELFPECTDRLVLYCLRSRMIWTLAFQDVRVCRFVVACARECDIDDSYEQYWLADKDVYPELQQLGETERALALRALRGAEAAMAEHLLQHFGALDEDSSIDALMTIPSRICNVSEARIERGCSVARELASQLSAHVGDGFSFSIDRA